jgi:hypothetical protein
MTTTELSELDARAAHLTAVAETKFAAYRAASAAARTAFDARYASQVRLEALYGDEWYLHTDAQHDTLRRACVAAMQVSDRASRASDRAESRAQRASNHRVIRSYTDATGWTENPNFFGRHLDTTTT